MDEAPVQGKLVERLLGHYDAGRRELPWRQDADPYRVWVAEVMLQQTRVETAIPYYTRWLERYPTAAALAEAPLDDVLRSWEGLGYYARARNLHRAARLIRDRHGGELPSEPAALRSLPGFGEYTAGAVGSIAFGRRVPAVDGNARRVLCRHYDLPRPSARELHDLAAGLVPADRPGDFNQALMELGATICTPRLPRCDSCPLAADCRAHLNGTQHERPARKPVRRIPHRTIATAVLVSADGRALLVRRPADGLLGGLWEFPGAVVRRGQSPGAAAAGRARELLGRTTGGGTVLEPVEHAFSHLRVTYHPIRFHVDRGSAAATTDWTADRAVVWATAAELRDLALPVAQRKIAAAAYTWNGGFMPGGPDGPGRRGARP